MKKVICGLVILLLLVFVSLVFFSRNQAHVLTHNPKSDRVALTFSPSDVGLPYKDVTVINDVKQTLHGWYVPPQNGAVIMLLHGYKSNRNDFRKQAEIFVRNGYGVLCTSMRSHDINDGELISFGLKEMSDFDAWYDFIKVKEDIKHIGMLGNSLGGYLAIQYASSNKNIEAIVTESAFSSVEDTLDTSIKFFTGLPPFIFSPLIAFWMEREIQGDIEDLSAKKWISQISPRAIFILHGGADNIVSPESGELLYQAAKEPKEFWFESELGHCAFDYDLPEEFEKRIVGFFDQYLLKKNDSTNTF